MLVLCARTDAGAVAVADTGGDNHDVCAVIWVLPTAEAAALGIKPKP